MYSDEAVDVLVKHLNNREYVSLYLDATGGVVQKPHETYKQVNYYANALTGFHGDTPPIPICELISSNHTYIHLRSWLATYSQIISDRTQKPVFKIETDFSWALLKSAVFAFNGLEIKEYTLNARTASQQERLANPIFNALQ